MNQQLHGTTNQRTYKVRVEFLEIWEVEVTASSQQEASDLAMIDYDRGRLIQSFVQDIAIK